MLIRSTAFMLAAILINMSMAAFATAGAQQQGEPKVESDGGLTATLNDESFTTGDTITVSGTVEERRLSSSVIIEVIDPVGMIVERGFVPISADNEFTYSFVAGEQEQFDPDMPMITSGDYRMIVRYSTPEDILDFQEVEFIFEYTAISSGLTTGGATTTDATTGDNSTSGAGTINVMAINQSTVEAITYTEQAYIAMQNNDTRSVFRNLNLALNALESIQGNLTLTAPDGGAAAAATTT
jgi:hypothetical protein